MDGLDPQAEELQELQRQEAMRALTGQRAEELRGIEGEVDLGRTALATELDRLKAEGGGVWRRDPDSGDMARVPDESEPAYTPPVITDVNTIPTERSEDMLAAWNETREAQGLTKTRFYRTSDGRYLTTREAEEEFGPIGTVAVGGVSPILGLAARTQHSMGQWSIGIRENNQTAGAVWPRVGGGCGR